MKVLYDSLPQDVKSILEEGALRDLRLKAAKGVFPLSPPSQLSMLLYLIHDSDTEVRRTAADTISKMPVEVVEEGVKRIQAPIILEEVYEHLNSTRIQKLLIYHSKITQDILVKIAKSRNAEVVNELSYNVELLRKFPEVVSGLIENSALELGRREYLKEIFDIKDEKGEVKKEEWQTKEKETEGRVEEDEVKCDEKEAEEMIKSIISGKSESSQEYEDNERNLLKRLHTLTVSQKIKLATTGPNSIRKALLRDSNKQIALAALRSPKTTDADAEEIARSRNVVEDMLREIANNRAWMKNYRIRLALVQNPKTPVPISMRLLRTLNERDIKNIAKDKNVPTALTAMAKSMLKEK